MEPIEWFDQASRIPDRQFDSSAEIFHVKIMSSDVYTLCCPYDHSPSAVELP